MIKFQSIIKNAICSSVMLFTFFGFSQVPDFSRQDTLRGNITPGRAWWDLKHYELSVRINPSDSSISGWNTIRYKVIEASNTMQVDLQSPMKITRILQDGKELKFHMDGNAHFIKLKKKQKLNEINSLTVYFEGKPPVSTDPPWSGGFSWSKDTNGKPFIATTCQGIGASTWWPCKDHPADEPDSMKIYASIPAALALTAVSNGRLADQFNSSGFSTFVWNVRNPINNYAVNINIGDYVNFSEKYQGEKGTLDCSYYVLRDHLKAATEHFKQVPKMLQAFEHWFGAYPFYEDGYKLVEVPYLGMEHQSSVTYGNNFKNGYNRKGKQVDLSNSGWGFNFDFIIIHESGHEWFANSITNQDVADMWIHESFTSYAENLYLDFHFGKEACNDYVIGTRKNILNDRPLIGIYNVNHEGSVDMYYKGANMLHTLRQLVDNDEKWREILRKMNAVFYHQTVTTEQIEDFLSTETEMDLKPFFDQYLRDVRIPVFTYWIGEHGDLLYHWDNCVDGFNMSVKVNLNGKDYLLQPEKLIKRLPLENGQAIVVVDRNFYVEVVNGDIKR